MSRGAGVGAAYLNTWRRWMVSLSVWVGVEGRSERDAVFLILMVVLVCFFSGVGFGDGGIGETNFSKVVYSESLTTVINLRFGLFYC